MFYFAHHQKQKYMIAFYIQKVIKLTSGHPSFFISMVLLRIPTAVQPMTGIEGFKYQASEGLRKFIPYFIHLRLRCNGQLLI